LKGFVRVLGKLAEIRDKAEFQSIFSLEIMVIYGCKIILKPELNIPVLS